METVDRRPTTVDVAAWLLWALVAAGLAVAVLVVVYRERLAEDWSPMQSGDSAVRPIDFVPVIVVVYAVTAVIVLTLIPLMRHGHTWAWVSLEVLAVCGLLAAAATVQSMPDTPVRLWVIVAGVVSAVSLVFLCHPQTHRAMGSAGRIASADASADDAADVPSDA